MEKYDIFISYARKDYVTEDGEVIPGNIVSRVKDFLREKGFTYWFDEDGIYSGEAFATIIAQAIRDSRVFLFISTQASNESEWTVNEIAVAKALGKQTIPFLADTSTYNIAVLMYLAPLDHIDYARKPRKAFDALEASLRNYLQKPLPQEEKATPTHMPGKAQGEESPASTGLEGKERPAVTTSAPGAEEATSAQERVTLSLPAGRLRRGMRRGKAWAGNRARLTWDFVRARGVRYELHYLLLLISALALGYGEVHLLFGASYILRDALLILSSGLCAWGVLSLLKGRKDGFVTLYASTFGIAILGWRVSDERLAMTWWAGCCLMIAVLYLLHRTDKATVIRWEQMRYTRIRKPVLCMAAVTLLFAGSLSATLVIAKRHYRVCVNSPSAILTMLRWHAIAATEWDEAAIRYSNLGDAYYCGKIENYDDLKRDRAEALKYYRLAAEHSYPSDGSEGSLDWRIRWCEEYLIAKNGDGHYKTSKYGWYGITDADELVMIGIEGFLGTVHPQDSLRLRLRGLSRYYIYSSTDLLDQSPDGHFEIEGGRLNHENRICDVWQDSLVITFKEGDRMVARRCVKAEKRKREKDINWKKGHATPRENGKSATKAYD